MFSSNQNIINKFIKIQQLISQAKKDVCLVLVNELLFKDKQTSSSYLMLLWAQLQLHGDNPSSPVVSLAAIDEALKLSIILDPFNIQARIELCKFLYSIPAESDKAREHLSDAKNMIDALRRQVLKIEEQWGKLKSS